MCGARRVSDESRTSTRAAPDSAVACQPSVDETSSAERLAAGLVISRRHADVTAYVIGTNIKWRSRFYCDVIFAVGTYYV